MGNLNTKMTALADEIRELSGTTTTKSIDAMTTDVGAANTEISEQMELIAQISTALEGKAAGSGGASVETCTVTGAPSCRIYVSFGENYLNNTLDRWSMYGAVTCTIPKGVKILIPNTAAGFSTIITPSSAVRELANVENEDSIWYELLTSCSISIDD